MQSLCTFHYGFRLLHSTSGDKKESGGISLDLSHNSGATDVKMDWSTFDEISKDCLPLLN